MNKFILFFLILSLVACGADASSSAATSAGPIVDKAQAEQDRLAAEQRIREANRQIALSNARIAQATSDAQAFELSQRKAAAAATADAVKLQSTIAADNARAAMQARSAAATASAQSAALAASATTSAQEIQQGIERAQATATQQAIGLLNDRARADEARARSDSDFYNGLWRVVIVAVIGALLLFGLYAANGILNVSLMRRAIIETRNGTAILIFQGGQPSAHILNAPALPQLEPGDESAAFDHSQAHTIDAESTFVYNANGQSTIMLSPTADNATDHRLALRLLRESMKLNGPQSDTIPTADQLKWSDHTRLYHPPHPTIAHHALASGLP